MPRHENNWSVVVKVMQGRYKQTFGPYFLTGNHDAVKKIALDQVCTDEYEGRLDIARLREVATVNVSMRAYRD